MLVRSGKPNENMPESNAKPTSVRQWVVDASKTMPKPVILSRNGRGVVKFMIYISNGEAGSPLLLDHSGHSDTQRVSTSRDIFISAMISDIFRAE